VWEGPFVYLSELAHPVQHTLPRPGAHFGRNVARLAIQVEQDEGPHSQPALCTNLLTLYVCYPMAPGFETTCRFSPSPWPPNPVFMAFPDLHK
jgi:hypothetical protein